MIQTVEEDYIYSFCNFEGCDSSEIITTCLFGEKYSSLLITGSFNGVISLFIIGNVIPFVQLGHSKNYPSVNSLSFNDEKGYVLAGYENGLFLLWDIKTEKVLREFNMPQNCKNPILHKSGLVIAVQFYSTIELWSLETCKKFAIYSIPSIFISFTSDGQSLLVIQKEGQTNLDIKDIEATNNLQITVWNLSTAELTQRIVSRFDTFCSIFYLKESNLLSIGFKTGCVELINLNCNYSQILKIPDAGIAEILCISPDGTMIIGGNNKCLTLWTISKTNNGTKESFKVECSKSIAFPPSEESLILSSLAFGYDNYIVAITRKENRFLTTWYYEVQKHSTHPSNSVLNDDSTTKSITTKKNILESEKVVANQRNQLKELMKIFNTDHEKILQQLNLQANFLKSLRVSRENSHSIISILSKNHNIITPTILGDLISNKILSPLNINSFGDASQVVTWISLGLAKMNEVHCNASLCLLHEIWTKWGSQIPSKRSLILTTLNSFILKDVSKALICKARGLQLLLNSHCR